MTFFTWCSEWYSLFYRRSYAWSFHQISTRCLKSFYELSISSMKILEVASLFSARRSRSLTLFFLLLPPFSFGLGNLVDDLNAYRCLETSGSFMRCCTAYALPSCPLTVARSEAGTAETKHNKNKSLILKTFL